MNRRWANGRRASALVLGASLLVAACGAATSSPSAAPAASPTAAGSGNATGSASAGPSAGEPASPSSAASESPDAAAGPSGPDGAAAELCATDQQPCPLEPGTYTTRPFEPEFTFTVGDGWSNDRLFADGGQVSKGPAGFVWASSVTVGQVDGAQVDIAEGVEGFLAHLDRFAGFDVSQPEDVTIDGVTGSQVDVTTNDADAPGIYSVAEDRMNLGPGEKARFLLLDKDGATVILIIEAYEEDRFEAFLEEAQPLVDSIRWQ